MSTTSEDTPKRMGKPRKGDRLDASRFQSPGINYKGKLIGVEDVSGPRGDKMCQVAMAKVKAAVKTIGEHKLKIIVNVSLDGVRIVEEKSESILYFHPVQRISFISRDPGDPRAFGYIYGREDGSHQFYGIKTEKVAENIVLNLRDLFQIVYEMKKQEKEELQDSFVRELPPSSTAKKGQNTKNGFDQSHSYSSSVTTLSSGHRAPTKTNGSGHCSSSQTSVSRDGNYVASPGGFQRGVLQHHSSEMRHSAFLGKHSQTAGRQYSSMTLSDRHQFHPSLVGSSVLTRQQSASDAVSTSRTSPLAKSRPRPPSVQLSGWFPVAIPPPEDSKSSLMRRTAAHPPDGLNAPSVHSSSAAEGWAVFETDGQDGPSLAVVGGENVEETAARSSVLENIEEVPVVETSVLPPGNEAGAAVDGEADERSVDAGVVRAVGVKKSPLISGAKCSGLPRQSESPGDVVNCTFYSHVECSGVSPKSPSGVPKLASPESLSDEEEEEEAEEEEENSMYVVDFPSPDAPPPPLPLDMVVDYTLQPPVLPPRPAVFESAVSRFSAESAESSIYSNLPVTESTAAAGSFTLPRLLQPNGGHVRPRIRPIQAGYDLTMPRPRPVPSSTTLRPFDDPDFDEKQMFTHPRFLSGMTSARQNEVSSQSSLFATSSNADGSTNPGSANNISFTKDPFAICLLSKGIKPQTAASLSSDVNDGLVHTSISPIPRPRPRQRSVPSAARGSGAGVASKSENGSSSFQTSAVDDANQLNPRRPIRTRCISNRTEHSPSSLSRRKVKSVSERVTGVLGAGSNRSDVTPDPFTQVDPFATDNFSCDPFVSQPDPLCFESPSDPFSKEFPTKASFFYTRAVTVEMGDVFDDAASAAYEPDAQTTAEPGSVKRRVHVSTSESAMERKTVILLEKAMGDSTEISVEGTNFHLLESQSSQKRAQPLPKDNVATSARNGNVSWQSDQNWNSVQELAASEQERQAVPVVEKQAKFGSCSFTGERTSMVNAMNFTESKREEFGPKIYDSTLQTDTTEGFSDSFDPC